MLTEAVLALALQFQPWVMAASHANWNTYDKTAWMAGLIHTESTWNPKARSPTNAKGLGQWTTIARKQVCRLDVRLCRFDPYDAKSSIKATGVYLVYLESLHYRQSDCEKHKRATACYNGGCGLVASAVRRFGNDWPQKIKAETRKYLPRVFKFEASYIKAGWPGVAVC